MGKSKLHLKLFHKFLNLRKFLFWFSLQTGVQTYGFISFISSILIVDVLLAKLIDQQLCAAYRSKDDLFQCFSSKHMILSQACQAFMSALLLCCLKRSSVPLCWVGCKFAVSVVEFTYLLEWSRDLCIHFFNLHLHIAWFTTTFICVYAYGVLVALNYQKELEGNRASYNFPPDVMETNVDIPVPPELPHF